MAGGAKAVALLTFEMDAAAPPPAGRGEGDDLSAMSHRAYGPRVGVPRLLQTLTALDVPATFFNAVAGKVADRGV